MLAVALFSLCLPAAIAQEQTLQLHRPAIKGSQYRLKCEAKNRQTVLVTEEGVEKNSQNNTSSLDFEAEVTVLDVHPNGFAATESFKVVKCQRTENGKTTELAPKGAVITVRAEAMRFVIEMDGLPASAQVQAALPSLILVRLKSDLPTDDIFGTSKKQKPGDSWPIDAGRMAASYAKRGAPLLAENIEGKMTFEKIVPVGGLQCFQITGRILRKNLASPFPDLKLELGERRMDLLLEYPVDKPFGPVERGVTMTTKYRRRGPLRSNVPDSVVTQTFVYELKQTITH